MGLNHQSVDYLKAKSHEELDNPWHRKLEVPPNLRDYDTRMYTVGGDTYWKMVNTEMFHCGKNNK